MDASVTRSTAPYQGLQDKVNLIRGYFPDSLRRPIVRSYAESISFNARGEADVVHFYDSLKAVLRYLPDPVGAEQIKAPWVMVGEIQDNGWSAEDCDGMASLAYTLLHSVGISAQLAVGWYGRESNPGHIWVRIRNKDRTFTDFDLAAGRKLGETKAGATRVVVYD